MTYYTIYKITNQIDGKIYIGSHKTKDLNDDYMGSGKYLKHAQEKYGLENFKKEILFVFDTPEEMYAKEKELVNEEFLALENTYNLKVGGFGGWDHLSKEHKAKGGKSATERIKSRRQSDPEYNAHIYEIFSKCAKVAIENLQSRRQSDPEFDKQFRESCGNSFRGKKHSEETKQKMRKPKNVGEANSQFGTCWVTNGIPIKIKKEQLDEYLLNGYRRGRK